MQIFDTAIILGHVANNGVLSARQIKRANKAIELFKKGEVKHIITTGGVGGLFNNTSTPLGKQIKNYISSKTVPEDIVFDENKSTDTAENAVFSLEIMNQHAFKSAVVVSSFPHILRAKLIFAGVFSKDIKLSYRISDFWGGFSYTIWDTLWEIGGWLKYFFNTFKNGNDI